MRYVNDKYREYYKKIDMLEKYGKDKNDYSNIIMALTIAFPFVALFFFGVAISIANENDSRNNKDKFIEIGRNSLGCVRYRYNHDTVWKCPENVSISQIERNESTGTKVRTNTTYYEPVVK